MLSDPYRRGWIGSRLVSLYPVKVHEHGLIPHTKATLILCAVKTTVSVIALGRTPVDID